MAKEKKDKSDSRPRHFAFVFYGDSSYVDWEARLRSQHIQAFVSPVHDNDLIEEDDEIADIPMDDDFLSAFYEQVPSGNIEFDLDNLIPSNLDDLSVLYPRKKPHRHLLMYFPGKKSPSQVSAILDDVFGPSRPGHFETVGSYVGYARYLCHLDEPEGITRYSPSDVLEFGGAKYSDIIRTQESSRIDLRGIFQLIEDEDIRYFDQLVRFCMKPGLDDYFNLITESKSFPIVQYLKAREQRAYRQSKKKQMVYGYKQACRLELDGPPAPEDPLDAPFVDDRAEQIVSAAKSALEQLADKKHIWQFDSLDDYEKYLEQQKELLDNFLENIEKKA